MAGMSDEEWGQSSASTPVLLYESMPEKTVKTLPRCLTLEEAKHWQRLCCAAEQPSTDSEVVEIEHENWASNPEQQYVDVTCH